MDKKLHDNNVISIEDLRKKSAAKKETIENIIREVYSGKYVSAVAFLTPSDGSETIVMANTKLSPLEVSGLLLNASVNCCQKSTFVEKSEEDKVQDKDE